MSSFDRDFHYERERVGCGRHPLLVGRDELHLRRVAGSHVGPVTGCVVQRTWAARAAAILYKTCRVGSAASLQNLGPDSACSHIGPFWGCRQTPGHAFDVALGLSRLDRPNRTADSGQEVRCSGWQPVSSSEERKRQRCSALSSRLYPMVASENEVVLWLLSMSEVEKKSSCTFRSSRAPSRPRVRPVCGG